MSAKFELGNYFGLRFTASRNVLYGIAIIWVAATAFALVALRLALTEAILGGLACAVGHELLVILHQLGHAYAARRTGYPMKGVHFWWVLSRSMYSSSEGDLPGSVHIRRALGGPALSAAASIVLAVIASAFRPWDQTPGWIAAFLFLDCFLTFTVGAFLPLGFTDGSTLLRWWGK